MTTQTKFKPLVSVLMSVHNDQNTLYNCLISIKNQTYTNWELIICDDASTDKSSLILKEFSNKDHRIKLINNHNNLGLAASLNKCMKLARGKYIARMDADDVSLPKRFNIQVDFLEKHPKCTIAGSSMIVKNDNGIAGVRNNISQLTSNAFLKGSPFFHPTIMMRRSALVALGGYNTKVSRAEDLELWFRLYNMGFEGVNIQMPLYVYHETLNDLNKRTLKSAIDTSRVFYRGYRLISIPWYKRWVAIKPIISSLMPNILLNYYHKLKLN
ncbi:glycosyltransferase family 2 protein [Limosilactobacillus reuteri]|uniref:glycosyltransferase family 2 protein n=1 Tax=Limosilactobacillus reuteri TaxID=1598 RepID=UPI0013E96512|nr:glycosyltransferase family 2 protein [Limosilactobacillus reuteri]QWS03272.1 glycosyltransferase family 2 protein [Limosilactobacillus reuteri]